MRSVAVVGASLAGLSTARALRNQGFDGRLTLIGTETRRPYDRPPLSKAFLAGRCDEAALRLERDSEDLGVDWLLGRTATGLDGRTITLDDGAQLAADAIVIATGARARALGGGHLLRTLDDARALRAVLATAHRIVVVGAGFIGAEVASTARGLGLDVAVVEALATPLAGPLGATMGGVVASLHADHGVRLRCGIGVDRLTGDSVLLADGTHLAADAVVVGIGARPCVDWLAGSGLAVGDGIHCDATGATNLPGVYAVGDCAAWYEPRLDRHTRIEHWTAASERPRILARALLGGEPTKPRLPYFWSDQYGLHLQFAGHTDGADEVTVEDGTVAERRFVAVYRRAGQPVAVLGIDSVAVFSRWRRHLETGTSPVPRAA